MDILCEQGNSEPLGGDLWKTLVVHSSVNYSNQVLTITNEFARIIADEISKDDRI